MRKACVYAGAMEAAHLIRARQIALTMHHRTHGTLLLLLTVAEHSRNHIISGYCIHRGPSLVYYHSVSPQCSHETRAGMGNARSTRCGAYVTDIP
jgi:hypothetical protein